MIFLNHIFLPAVEPVVKVDSVEADGIHFSWNLQDIGGAPIKSITLAARPVDGATVSLSVDPHAKNGILSSGLKPYTEYDTSVDVVRNGDNKPTIYKTGKQQTWPAGSFMICF